MSRHDDDLRRDDPVPRDEPPAEHDGNLRDERPRDRRHAPARDLDDERLGTAERAPAGRGDGLGLLLEDDRLRLRDRWESVQASFIDEPRGSVAEADRLVSDTIERMMDGFHEQRRRLEHHWDGGDEVSTEDLRQALRRYRAFFESLLEL